jgi:hypothetical protein
MATAQKHQPNNLTSPREKQPRTNLGRGEPAAFPRPLSGMQKHQPANPRRLRELRTQWTTQPSMTAIQGIATHDHTAAPNTRQGSRPPQPQKTIQQPTLQTRRQVAPKGVNPPLLKTLTLTLAILALAFSLNPSTINTTPPTCTPQVSAVYKAAPTLNTVVGELIAALHDMLQSRLGNLHQQTQTRRELGRRPARRPRPARQGRASWPAGVTLYRCPQQRHPARTSTANRTDPLPGSRRGRTERHRPSRALTIINDQARRRALTSKCGAHDYQPSDQFLSDSRPTPARDTLSTTPTPPISVMPPLEVTPAITPLPTKPPPKNRPTQNPTEDPHRPQ